MDLTPDLPSPFSAIINVTFGTQLHTLKIVGALLICHAVAKHNEVAVVIIIRMIEIMTIMMEAKE